MSHLPSTTAAAVVEEFHRAWTRGDVDHAMTLVADDVICHAPGEELVGRKAYRTYLAGFAPALTGIGDIGGIDAGDRVALFYHPRTAATTTASAAELFTVRDGRIVENVLVFDRLSFAAPEQGVEP